MVGIFRRRKAKEEEQSSPAPAPPVTPPAIERPPTRLPILPNESEPDYQDLPELRVGDAIQQQQLAPMLLIGLGPLGRAVLEALGRWLPLNQQTGERAAAFLAISLQGETAYDYELPESAPRLLADHERLVLNPERGSAEYSWYRAGGSEFSRPDGRLAIFQSLERSPAPLWNKLQNLLKDGKRDVWLVGAAFGPSSGMLPDLAHLVRLVSDQQGYHPFIGWMLALPNLSWASTHQVEAAATLREAERLLRPRVKRHYEAYAPGSDNPSLHADMIEGDDDAQSVILCEPDADLFGLQAARALVAKMALALLICQQARMWNLPGDENSLAKVLRKSLPRPIGADGLFVSAFGASLHSLPDEPLKHWVRSRLAADVLLNRDWGAVRVWSEDELEINEEAGRAFLQNCGHPLLVLLSAIRSRFDLPESWPPLHDADQVLALGLWQQFSSFLQVRVANQGLQACANLVASVESVLQGVDLPEGVVGPLQHVLEKASGEMQSWVPWLRAVRGQIQERLAIADDEWELALTSTFEHTVLPADYAETVYKYLTSNNEDLPARLRQHVGLAWVRRGAELELRLDVLAPGWKSRGAPQRFAPNVERFGLLWEQLLAVTAALTGQESHWPAGLIAAAGQAVVTASSDEVVSKKLAARLLPDVEQASQATKLTLQYGAFPKGLSQARLVYKASGDAAWRGRNWVQSADNPQQIAVDVFPPTMGMLLQVYHPIPLNTVSLFVGRMQKAYQESIGRNLARDAHIYLAEQRACEYERVAINTLPYRERGLVRPWLLHRTVDLLEKPVAVEIFLRAWCAGLVQPAIGPGRYVLRAGPENEVLWSADKCEHILDALAAFTRLEVAPLRGIERSLQEALERSHPSFQEERLAQIADWSQAGKVQRQVEGTLKDARDLQEQERSQKDYDWFVLVNGLQRRKQE